MEVNVVHCTWAEGLGWVPGAEARGEKLAIARPRRVRLCEQGYVPGRLNGACQAPRLDFARLCSIDTGRGLYPVHRRRNFVRPRRHDRLARWSPEIRERLARGKNPRLGRGLDS